MQNLATQPRTKLFVSINGKFLKFLDKKTHS